VGRKEEGVKNYKTPGKFILTTGGLLKGNSAKKRQKKQPKKEREKTNTYYEVKCLCGVRRSLGKKQSFTQGTKRVFHIRSGYKKSGKRLLSENVFLPKGRRDRAFLVFVEAWGEK